MGGGIRGLQRVVGRLVFRVFGGRVGLCGWCMWCREVFYVGRWGCT